MGSDTRMVFSTAAYEYLRDELCAAAGWQVGTVERRAFPDGEQYYRVDEACRGQHVVLVGGTISAHDFLELYDLACGLVHWGAAKIDVVIPYFGHSTMERAERPGEVVTAKTRARLLSSIPAAALGNRIFAIDLHVDAIAYYFERDVRPTHIYARSLITDIVRGLGSDDYVIGCTDAGRAKWVERLAHDLGVTAAFVYKRRVSGDSTEVSGVSAHVSDKMVVVYDDMVRTGSSLLGAGRAYLDAGASSVSAVATHGLFPGDALAHITDAGVFQQIVCTNSHARTQSLRHKKLRVESVAPLLLDYLQ